MKLIAGLQENAIFRRPTRIIAGSSDQRAPLCLVEICPVSEEGDVNTPFILGTRKSRRAVDDDFALMQGKMSFVKEATSAKAIEETPVGRERREQGQRRNARWHHAVEDRLELGCIRRLDGCNTGCHWMHLYSESLTEEFRHNGVTRYCHFSQATGGISYGRRPPWISSIVTPSVILRYTASAPWFGPPRVFTVGGETG
jgi:hypothetical protein